MSRQKRTMRWLAVALAIMVMYIGSFFAIRDWTWATSITGSEEEMELSSIKVYYFSKNRTANAMLFYCFFPIHAIVGRPYFAHTLTEQEFDDYDGWPYYLYDPSEVAID